MDGGELYLQRICNDRLEKGIRVQSTNERALYNTATVSASTIQTE